MNKLFEGIKKGLEEALALVEEETGLKSELIEIPDSFAISLSPDLCNKDNV